MSKARPVQASVPEVPIHLIVYDKNEVREEFFDDVESLGTIRESTKDGVIWIDLDGPCSSATLAEIGKIFNLHSLALEDVEQKKQRPKIDDYKDHHFMVCRMVSYKSCVLDSEQMSIFFGKGFVLTFQEKPNGDCLEEVRESIRKGKGRIRELGADHLLYAILDAVIDAYFPVLNEIEAELEQAEEQIDEMSGAKPNPGLPSTLHGVRRNLMVLRQKSNPLRDAMHILARNVSTSMISEDTRIHLRDCYDHVIRVLDLIETLRDISIGLRDLYQSKISNHMNMVSQQTNEVMKVLAIITTIFTPLTLIAGIYGMNFNPDKSPLNMPELNWFYGYPFALSLMLIVFVGLGVFIWRRGWLNSSVLPTENRPPINDEKD